MKAKWTMRGMPKVDGYYWVFMRGDLTGDQEEGWAMVCYFANTAGKDPYGNGAFCPNGYLDDSLMEKFKTGHVFYGPVEGPVPHTKALPPAIDGRVSRKRAPKRAAPRKRAVKVK